jgi:tRNA A-37 threonylcarbamoyl transferase component Bud32
MTQPIAMAVAGVRWQVLPEFRERLFGPQGLLLNDWLQSGQAQVVKHGSHRTVYRVILDGLTLYLKHFRLSDLRSWCRQLIRPSKARLEYQRAVALASRQVPTILPVALGERATGLRPAESFLITQGLDDTEPFNAFLERTLPTLSPARQARVGQRLAVELGQLVARMHEGGIVHQDLHPANLLVRLEADDQPRLYVIDLHPLRLGRPLSWRASRKNLVLLNRWFSMRVSRSDRLRFWRTYCRVRNIAAGEQARRDELGADVERRTWQSNLDFWKKRDRRCLGNNRSYRRVRSAVACGHAVADLDAQVLAALLADPDEPFRRPGVTLLKDSRSSTVAEFDLPIGGSPRRVIYKRFRVTSWSDPWAALLRPSAALRSWVNGHGLLLRYLPTARPLAVFHRRRHGLSYEGYLLTEKVPDAVDLHGFVAGLNALPDAQRRHALRCRIEQVARLVRELHRRQLSHRDLKAANILLSGECQPPGAPKNQGVNIPRSPENLWLIDLVGVRLHGRLPRWRKVRNLARLHASFFQNPVLSRTDKLRFLRTYLNWGLFGRGSWKRWWHEIEQATLAKAARNARNGRPLA